MPEREFDATVGEVLKTVLGRVSLLGSVEAGLAEADGMFLASDAVSAADVPSFANSAVDGYALDSADLHGGSGTFDVAEEVPAGSVPRESAGRGRAILVMTGAPLPVGANAVVPVEDAVRSGGRVAVERYSGKANVRPAGEIAKRGDLLVRAGSRLGPAELAVLASAGAAGVEVRRRPVVTVISTGDELVAPGGVLNPGKIWACNSYSLAAMARRYGAVVRDGGIVGDRPETVAAAFREALDFSDVVVSSGGVSAGRWDFVKAAVADLCDEAWSWRINMQPGRPLAFGSSGGRLVFGLPGNPVAAMVSFYQFARAALLRMQGAADVSIPEAEAVLDEPVSRKEGIVHFLRARLRREGGVLHAAVTGSQGSAAIAGMAAADALIVVGPEKTSFEAGDVVRVQILDFKRHS